MEEKETIDVKKAITLCLTLLLCVSTLSAYAAGADGGPSSWAAEEVEGAIDMGFVPERLQSEYQKDITRDEFAELAVRFCMDQFGYEFGVNSFLEDYRENHLDVNGNPVKAQPEEFPDGTPYGTIASALGITNGKDEGRFDPDGSITRQEAAVMLARTYAAYAPELETDFLSGVSFADSHLFPSWAAESIRWLSYRVIMRGNGDNAFDPAGYFTREQSILTFLRLDRYAPYSRSRGGIKPIVSYEENLRRILTPEDGSTFTLTARYDKPDATVLLGRSQSADGTKTDRLWVVYTGSGGIGAIDLYPHAAKSCPGPYTIENISFNDSGSAMTYFVRSGERELRYDVALDLVRAEPVLFQTPTEKLQRLPEVFDGLNVTGYDGEYLYTADTDGRPSVYDMQGVLLFTGDAGTLSQAGEGLFLRRGAAGVTYYTAQGAKLNQTPYYAGTSFYSGRAAVQEKVGGKITVTDTSGAVMKTVDSRGGSITAGSFEEACVRLTANGISYLLNVDTGAKTSPKYIDALPFSGGYAAVRSEKDGWGYIKRAFTEAIPCYYGAVTPFSGIIATVADKELKFGAIYSYKSQTVVPFTYKSLTQFTPYGYALGEREDGQCVLIPSIQFPVALLAGSFDSFQLYGKYAVQETATGKIVLGGTGESLFPGLIVQEVYGSPEVEGIVVRSGGVCYLYCP